jgi:hypothetical protein
MRLACSVLVLGLFACGEPPEPEVPEYKPQNGAERFVARIVDNLALGRVDILERMMTPEAREDYSAQGFARLRAELAKAIGPLDDPHLLRVRVIAVNRDDGTVGLFGHARAGFARGIAELRVEILCAPNPKADEWCVPPYMIEAMTIDTLPPPPKRPPRE